MSRGGRRWTDHVKVRSALDPRSVGGQVCAFPGFRHIDIVEVIQKSDGPS
ncbi:hypothetical protein [Streptomyces sp. NPDC005336]